MKEKLMKVCGAVASLAKVTAISGVSQTCIWLYHQPEVPKSLKKYKK